MVIKNNLYHKITRNISVVSVVSSDFSLHFNDNLYVAGDHVDQTYDKYGKWETYPQIDNTC